LPYNLRGCNTSDDRDSGVVDSFGRVFGYDNLMVVDGSIMPCYLGPNPALSILAFAECSTKIAIPQLKSNGKITTQP